MAMTLKTFFAIFALLSVLFGIGFVLAPGQVLSNYGVENSPAIAVMSRLFGGTLLAIAVIFWSARRSRCARFLSGSASPTLSIWSWHLLRPLPVRSMRWVGPPF